MIHRVNVCEHPDWLKAFERFSNTVWFLNPTDKSDWRIEGNIDEALRIWHCKNVANSPYLEFRSEKDAMLFLLRWS